MLRSMYSGISGLRANQTKLDVIGNNIANVGTTAFKSQRVRFQDMLSQSMKEGTGAGNTVGGTNPSQVGLGTQIAGIDTTVTQGNMQPTSNNLDFAIDGDGYFKVTLGNGTAAYERAGSFTVDRNGNLVDSNGNKLEVNLTAEGSSLFNSGMVFKDNNFKVDEKTGQIYMNVGNQSILYGRINIYNAVGQDSMKSIGDNLYQPANNVQMNINTKAHVIQGSLEQSNVDLGREMTDMIMAQRSFELASKGLTTSDEMWGLINSMKR